LEGGEIKEGVCKVTACDHIIVFTSVWPGGQHEHSSTAAQAAAAEIDKHMYSPN